MSVGAILVGTAAAAGSAVLWLPRGVWPSVLFAIVIGIVVLGVVRSAVWFIEKRRGNKVAGFWPELLRDIGIAFIVAGVVSGIYEYNTRSVEKSRTTVDALNAMMRLYIPAPVWNEVSTHVIRRPALRRNVTINIDISHEAPPVNGRVIPLPPGQSVMTMSYSYDLYALGSEPLIITVDHALDYYPMWNAGVQLPRFDKVLVAGPGTYQVYEGQKLRSIYDGKGSISVPVRLWPVESNKPVHIETERHELVNTPGSYYLVMRELTANEEGSEKPTVQITIILPPDLNADVQTYYVAHDFKRDSGKNRWTFTGTLLPGQGVDILFGVQARGSRAR